MRVLSLCSGIGGFDLACEAASMEIVGQVEIDDFCNRVLAYHWPHVKRMRDIFEVVGDEFGAIELVVAGFPCQPVSHAGKRRGQADDRWLWGEVARIIRVCQPAFVLLENVPGLISLGLDDVLGDLDAAGYEAAVCVYPAAAVGAPHERERVFIVGCTRALSDTYSDRRGFVLADTTGGARCRPTQGDSGLTLASGTPVAKSGSRGCETRQRDLSARQSDAKRGSTGVGLADTTGAGLSLARCAGEFSEGAESGAGMESEPQRCGAGQAQSCLGDAVDGLPGGLAGHPISFILSHRWPARPGETQHDWEMPRTVPASDRTPQRAAKLRALGNAVVPQQVYPLLVAIAETWAADQRRSRDVAI